MVPLSLAGTAPSSDSTAPSLSLVAAARELETSITVTGLGDALDLHSGQVTSPSNVTVFIGDDDPELQLAQSEFFIDEDASSQPPSTRFQAI